MGGYSVRSAGRNLAGANHVQTAGENSHNILETVEVSETAGITTHQFYLAIFVGRREIKALGVLCSNMERGCEWVGTVGTLEKHVATCGFTLVPCPKQCKDDKDVIKCFMQKDLDNHLENDCLNRDYECQSKCGEKGTYAYITEVHDETCEMKILPCPNDGCDTEIQRQQVSQHIRKCPHAMISCKHRGAGCDIKLKRKDMVPHEQDDKLHLHMALETVNSQNITIFRMQQLINSLKAEVNLPQWKKTYVLSEYQKIKEAGKIFRLSPFYASGYHMGLAVCANGKGVGEGTHVSVYVWILKGECDSELKWPFIGTVTFTLLNRLEDKNHYTGTVLLDSTRNAQVDNIWGCRKFIAHSALAHDPVKNTQYLMNDSLHFRMKVKVVPDSKSWLDKHFAAVIVVLLLLLLLPYPIIFFLS